MPRRRSTTGRTRTTGPAPADSRGTRRTRRPAGPIATATGMVGHPGRRRGAGTHLPPDRSWGASTPSPTGRASAASNFVGLDNFRAHLRRPGTARLAQEHPGPGVRLPDAHQRLRAAVRPGAQPHPEDPLPAAHAGLHAGRARPRSRCRTSGSSSSPSTARSTRRSAASGSDSGSATGSPTRRSPCSACSTVMVWQNIGFVMVIYLAGLATVPVELEEAAALDGAGTLAPVPAHHPADHPAVDRASRRPSC